MTEYQPPKQHCCPNCGRQDEYEFTDDEIGYRLISNCVCESTKHTIECDENGEIRRGLR